MGEWKKTGCVLCSQNCGLEALVEENRIVKVKPDKDNPRSQGYVCRKGLNIAYHQHHSDRLTHPLKKVGNDFVKISWEQAFTEIAEKLRGIVDQYGPRSFAYIGGGGQGCQSEAAFGMRLLRGMGSQYYYNALGQELTGEFWAYGKAIGRQYNFAIPDHVRSDLLLVIGWNPWMSHQMPQARRVIEHITKDPERLLVVIDPRRSETAERADIHLPIRQGTDALLSRALIALILQKGWQHQAYLDEYVSGFEEIKPWFMKFNVREACQVCELSYEEVGKLAHLLVTRNWCLHGDLGVLMNRHSTVTSYLQIILLAICGRLLVPGGNVVPSYLMTLGPHSDEHNPKLWRTVMTDFPPIMGIYPPNVIPEEIDNDHPERLRAVIVSACNPLRSYADTSAYEKAFSKLDILVTIEMAMTETARMSDYILPSRSAYEAWDTTYFQSTYPEVYFQMRRPIVEAEGEPLEISEIMTNLADKLGLIPEIPPTLYDAAQISRTAFGQALFAYVQAEPKASAAMPFIIARTLGKQMGSVNLAWVWAMLQLTPKNFRENAARVGFQKGSMMGDEIFQAIVDHPEGLWIGRSEVDQNMVNIKHEDGRINLFIPEVEEWVCGITPEAEAAALQADPNYPFILLAGRHTDMNANTIMRNPAWNRGRRACSLAMNPQDAEKWGFKDEQMVRVSTEAGSAEIEVETTASARCGMVIIPQGFGLDFEGEVYGINVNRLTKNTHRDPIAATPLHRYVRCRVDAIEV